MKGMNREWRAAMSLVRRNLNEEVRKGPVSES